MSIWVDLVAPVLVGLSSVFVVHYLDGKNNKKAELKAELDGEKEKMNQLENHFFKIKSHVDTLSKLINSEEGNSNVYNKHLISNLLEEVKSILKHLLDVDMNVLPNKELKHLCGYFVHALTLRENELKKLLNGEDMDKYEDYLGQIFMSSNLLNNQYIKSLSKIIHN